MNDSEVFGAARIERTAYAAGLHKAWQLFRSDILLAEESAARDRALFIRPSDVAIEPWNSTLVRKGG